MMWTSLAHRFRKSCKIEEYRLYSVGPMRGIRDIVWGIEIMAPVAITIVSRGQWVIEFPFPPRIQPVRFSISEFEFKNEG